MVSAQLEYKRTHSTIAHSFPLYLRRTMSIRLNVTAGECYLPRAEAGKL